VCDQTHHDHERDRHDEQHSDQRADGHQLDEDVDDEDEHHHDHVRQREQPHEDAGDGEGLAGLVAGVADRPPRDGDLRLRESRVAAQLHLADQLARDRVVLRRRIPRRLTGAGSRDHRVGREHVVHGRAKVDLAAPLVHACPRERAVQLREPLLLGFVAIDRRVELVRPVIRDAGQVTQRRHVIQSAALGALELPPGEHVVDLELMMLAGAGESDHGFANFGR
jgi:hypothetical protein